MEAFFQQLSVYGMAPVLIAVVFLLGWVVRELKENGKKDEARAKDLKDSMTAEMNAMAKRFDDHLAETNKKVDDLRDRVSCVERDYLPREEHYKEFSGWRTEINNIRDLLVSLFKDQAKKGGGA